MSKSNATQDQSNATPVVHDPEHDIDAKSATIWVLGGTIVLFLSLWIMVPIFVRVQEEEQRTKIFEAKNTELNELRAKQLEFLNGANPKNKTIDQALADALKK